MNDEAVCRIDEILNITYEGFFGNKVNFSFLNGFPGSFLINSLIVKDFDRHQSDLHAENVISLYQTYAHIFADPTTGDDVLNGRAGFLYALIFMRRFLEYPIEDDLLNEVI